MFKEIGTALIFLGILFLLVGWFNESSSMFIFEMVSGPILIYAGWQLMKW
jgi:hypothetical protein